jgi:DNA (cytosine-5)-methyltransferase 1
MVERIVSAGKGYECDTSAGKVGIGTMKPLLLDTFCGAGGCSMGYHRAGFDVVGVDINPQPHYPFSFILGDALEILARLIAGEAIQASDGKWYTLDMFAAVHASPPCQAYSVTRSLHDNEHPDMVEPTRAALRKTGLPYVIENVPGAPLQNYVMLCGTMFGLGVIRHRCFECFPQLLMAPMACHHYGKTGKSKGEYHTLDKSDLITCVGHNFQARSGRIAMDIDWMTRNELSQAIPPAYTEWIGRQLLNSGAVVVSAARARERLEAER